MVYPYSNESVASGYDFVFDKSKIKAPFGIQSKTGKPL